MKSSDVSVIIPTYNSLSFLQRTLSSLEKQRPDPGEFEVVVADDGSDDGTGEWLRTYSGPLKLNAIILSQNSGRSAARNAAAARVQGKILLMIDGDMELADGLVRGHAACHREGEDIVVMGRVIYDKSLGRRGFARYIETRGAAKLPYGSDLPGRYFISSQVSMPRQLFRRVEGFDPKFCAYGGEDLDIGMKLVAAGAQLVANPDLVTVHLHIRSLQDIGRVAFEYGRLNIPLLLDRHPQLYGQLKLDWPERKGLKGMVRKIVLSKPVYKCVYTVLRLLNWIYAPAFLYDYLIFNNYYSGFLQSENKTKQAGENGDNS